MADFSIGDAVAAGFRLIGRKPLAVLGWGIVYLVLTQSVNILFWMNGGGQMMQAMQQSMTASMAHPGAAPDMSGMMAMQSRLAMIWPLQMLGLLANYAILNAAVFRAVLEPRNEGFLYLRLGGDELWQGLLFICQLICSIGVIIGVALIGGVAIGVSAASLDPATRGWVGLAVFLLCAALLLWLFVRFSMAGPMTFADKTFRLFESWSFTGGHGWKLFGLGLLLTIILVAVGLVIDIVLFSVVLGSMGLGANPVNWAQHPAAMQEAMQGAMPYFIGFGIVASLFAGAFHAIVVAPWAEAYRQLSGRADAA